MKKRRETTSRKKELNASTPNLRNRLHKASLKPDAKPQEAEAHSATSPWKDWALILWWDLLTSRRYDWSQRALGLRFIRVGFVFILGGVFFLGGGIVTMELSSGIFGAILLAWGLILSLIGITIRSE